MIKILLAIALLLIANFLEKLFVHKIANRYSLASSCFLLGFILALIYQNLI